MDGLWISPSEFRSFSSTRREELFNELATREAAGEDVFGSFLGLLPDPDPILRKRGEDAEVLDELTADDQVTMAIQSRKLGTLHKYDYQIKPGHTRGEEPSTGAQRLADELIEDLERVDLYNVVSEILDAPYYGHTVAELMWRQDNGRIRLDGITVKPRRWFGFDGDRRLVFLSMGAPNGEPMPEDKFLVARHFPTYDRPHGLRLLSRCLWPVAFKKGGVRFWSNFMERFGIPWVIGKAPQQSSREERQRMSSDLASMVQTATAVLPSGSEVDIHEASGKSGDLHQSFVKMWDAAISKVLMGQTLTAELGKAGSRAASETHYAVLGDYREADERIVAQFFDSLGRIYGQLNAPGERPPVWRYEEPADQDREAALAKKITESGKVRFTSVFYKRRFGLMDDEFLVEGEGSQNEDHGGEFAEGEARDGQDALDAMLDDLMPEAQQAAEERKRAILEAVDRAESFEDMQILLAELLPELEADSFEQLMRRALLAADLHGQLTAREDPDAG
ncbi:phage portal protein family protein [Desulfohalovibrio reitneri]|uniref:phage portal protein family protein n=1 Tax=Desulfohalovibrio reitneri TaxID=1307759 RepID=UPI0004A6E860|nr:DUF935 family protein [Desulfohalovibrio reitneri]